MKFISILKTELSYNPAILFLGIYPKELKAGTQMDISIPLFRATLFTISQKVGEAQASISG